MSSRGPVIIAGGGLVGLAVALALRRRDPKRPIHLLEKERSVGLHQSGRNSGVLHSGVYYAPGSMKARLCVDGQRRMIDYLRRRQLPFRPSGKVIVARNDAEIPKLRELQRRAGLNSVAGVAWLDCHELKDREPEVRGAAGLWIPGTGVTDFHAVSRSLAEDLKAMGVEISLSTRVLGGIENSSGVSVATTSGSLDAAHFINCSGLYADRIARGFGLRPGVIIVPFRGEYFRLRRGRETLVRGLVYPVPDPRFPFLEVHFTPGVDGSVEVGPNAVWAIAREGYRRGSFDIREFATAWTEPGFLRLVRKYYREGIYEAYRSMDRGAFARDLRKLIPALEDGDLVAGDAGVRATAVAPDGSLPQDFVFVESRRTLHVLNAVSPAATASLAIGEHVAAQVPLA